MARRKSISRKMDLNLGIIDLEHPELYKPWLHTREVSSGNGRRHIIPDIFYPSRMIYLMSDLEKEVYYKLRCDKRVVELFEQVPLALYDTIDICEKLQVAHPQEPFTMKYSVMTTDFVGVIQINGQRELQAFAVKTSSDLKDSRVLEKMLIEQMFWERKNVKWSIITDKQISEWKGGVV